MKTSRSNASLEVTAGAEWPGVLRQAAAGDALACRALARRLGPRLRGFFRHQGLSDADAEILATECITQIILKANTVRNGEFLPWAFQVARNRLSDLRRAAPPAATGDLAEEIMAQEATRPARMRPSARRVRAWLQTLKPEDRRLLEAHYSRDDTTFAEIAAELGLSEAAARKRHERLCDRLEAALRADPAFAAELARMTAPKKP